MFPKCNAYQGDYNTGEGIGRRNCEGTLVPVELKPDGFKSWGRGAFEWKIKWECTTCGRKFPQ